jgi:hypothetical protein
MIDVPQPVMSVFLLLTQYSVGVNRKANRRAHRHRGKAMDMAYRNRPRRWLAGGGGAAAVLTWCPLASAQILQVGTALGQGGIQLTFSVVLRTTGSTVAAERNDISFDSSPCPRCREARQPTRLRSQSCNKQGGYFVFIHTSWVFGRYVYGSEGGCEIQPKQQPHPRRISAVYM